MILTVLILVGNQIFWLKLKFEIKEELKKWREKNERPAIKGSIPDVSQYDTIYIGSPIWWGEYPMVVRMFLDQVDLNGKP